MQPSEYPSVASFGNETTQDITLYLEMLGEQVVLAPGDCIELLAAPDPDMLPLTVLQVEGGLQIYPYKTFDPDWHVRFEGRIVRAGLPLRHVDAG